MPSISMSDSLQRLKFAASRCQCRQWEKLGELVPIFEDSKGPKDDLCRLIAIAWTDWVARQPPEWS